ncbi:MAG: hypothetical protein F6K54_09515 [Okeania sp. SIO3B5]|nr:hypothetical protein [Okeania sp. SIO3B5]
MKTISNYKLDKIQIITISKSLRLERSGRKQSPASLRLLPIVAMTTV